MKESLVSRQILNSSSKMSSNEDNFCQKAGKLASTNFCRSFHSLTVGCLPVLAYAWNARIIFDSINIFSPILGSQMRPAIISKWHSFVFKGVGDHKTVLHNITNKTEHIPRPVLAAVFKLVNRTGLGLDYVTNLKTAIVKSWLNNSLKISKRKFMKTKNILTSAVVAALLLSTGCVSKSISPMERVPAQQGQGTGDIGSSIDNSDRLDVVTNIFSIEFVSCKSIKLESSAEYNRDDSPIRFQTYDSKSDDPQAFDYEDRCYDKNNKMVYKQTIIQRKPVTRREDKYRKALAGNTITHEFFDASGKRIDILLDGNGSMYKKEYSYHNYHNKRLQKYMPSINLGAASTEYPTRIFLQTMDNGRMPVFLQLLSENNSPRQRIQKMISDDYEKIVQVAKSQLRQGLDVLPARGVNGQEYFTSILEDDAGQQLVLDQGGNRPKLPTTIEVKQKLLCTDSVVGLFKVSCNNWINVEQLDDARVEYYARLISNSGALDMPGIEMSYNYYKEVFRNSAKLIKGNDAAAGATVYIGADVHKPAFILPGETEPVNLISFSVRYKTKNNDNILAKMDFELDGNNVRVKRINILSDSSSSNGNLVSFFNFLKSKFGSEIEKNAKYYYKDSDQ